MQFAKPRAVPPRRLFPALLLTLGSCLAVTVGGCRSVSDNQIDLLERELRTQEDYIYELEDYVLEYSQKLRQCRGTTSHPSVIYSEPDRADPPRKSKSTMTKRRALPEEPIEPPELPKAEEPADELPLPTEPEPDVEEPATVELENLDIPDLEIGDPVGAMQGLPSVEQVAVEMWDDDPIDMVEHLFIPDPATFAPETEVEQVSNEQFDDQIDAEGFDDSESLVAPPYPIVPRVARQLEITQLFRGSGDSEAPTSLLTIVEALDDNGEPIDLDGEVSLMVMTADANAPQRLKRWNFSPEETAASWQSSQLGDGLHLELPLDEIQLPDTRLELWARLVLDDGRKLLTQVAFEPPELEALDQEMQPTELPPEDESRLAMIENEVDDAVVVDQMPAKLVPASQGTRADDRKPRWRASMQRTDFVTQSYSTTAKGAQRWTAQPLGGHPVPQALARRPVGQSTQSTESTEKGAGPKWQPFR